MTLTPTQLRILRILMDPDNEAESREEIALQINSSKDSVGNRLSEIYDHFGVRSSRGLLRCYAAIREAIK